MKITWIRPHTNAVGEYRARHPALALRELGHDTSIITIGQEPRPVCNEELAGDILVLQRATSDRVFDLLETIPAPTRPAVVYEVDDNPWEWHVWDPIHADLGADYGAAVLRVMARCQAVTCSTQQLAARIRRELPSIPIWVVPNAIDYQLRDWDRREMRSDHHLGGKIVLGWTGSVHHEMDGVAMLQALPAVFGKHPDTVFLMQCDRPAYYQWTNRLHGQYRDRLRWVPPLPFDIHPMIYSLFDVNLAPLSNTPFNRCKSDLRLIEGGAHGTPYVASNVAPYAEFHRQSGGVGGLLADRPGDWARAIDGLIGQRAARGTLLKRHVRETRSLSVVAGQWQAAYRDILAGRMGQPVLPSTEIGPNDPCPCGDSRKYKHCCIPAYG